MSLNKKKMVREIGRRTRIKNRDVQAVIEALIDVWTEELVGGGSIEIQGLFKLQARQSVRHNPITDQPHTDRRLHISAGNHLLTKLHRNGSQS